MVRRFGAFLVIACLVVGAAGVPAAVSARDPSGAVPAQVKSNSDAAKSKLHPRLQKQVESGSTKVTVFATVSGDTAEVEALLTKPKVAENDGVALVVGSITVQALPKLAGAEGVVSVNPVDFKQTGRPLGDLEARLHPGRNWTRRSSIYDNEVPYGEAPPLAGSNFEELKELALLDAKTHEFADAWDAGFTGTGTVVGVMDGGTDFGHPDLVGTWTTWSGLTGTRAGWNGWPKAFDPYGSLIWLAEREDLVDDGLSWHTKSTAVTCPGWADKAPQATCPVKFSTVSVRRGTSACRTPRSSTPTSSRRASRSPATYGSATTRTITCSPSTASASRTSSPTRRPASRDTVYVDLDNDHDFRDEKPVTKASPASYRDMDGDGYTDLSGGLLYFISDGVTRAPGGQDAFGVNLVYAPGQLVSWSGDYDPGIGGHGTLTASNVVGQGVINGNAPTFSDLPGDGKYPGAVIGGAPHAKLAPYGDIYFSFDFSTQFGYFLAVTRGVDITSNSYGKSDVDNDGWDAASQEADFIYAGSRTTCSRRAMARRASGRSPRRARPRGSPWVPRHSSAAPAGIRSIGPIRSTTRKSWSGPTRLRRERHQRRRHCRRWRLLRG